MLNEQQQQLPFHKDILIQIMLYQFQKETKHSCSTVTLEEPPKCPTCQPCSYGQCNGHSSKQTCEKSCTCRLTPPTDCKKCNMAKTLAMENSKTKCKLEQLRLVMQQKKQKREARKLKTLPYTTPPKSLSPDQAAIQEEIETVA